MEKILGLAEFLRESNDPVLKNLSNTLSTRQLLRIAHRMSVYSSDNVSTKKSVVLRYTTYFF